MGGNRKGKARTYINLMITMLLGGLWHGAHWRFIIWGGLHGLGLVVERAFRRLHLPADKNRIWRFAGVFITFHLVTFLWIFFRSDDLDSSMVMIRNIFHPTDPVIALAVLQSSWPVISLILLAMIIHWLPSRLKEWYRGIFIRTPFILKVLIAALAVFMIVQMKSSDIQPFIYFQF